MTDERVALKLCGAVQRSKSGRELKHITRNRLTRYAYNNHISNLRESGRSRTRIKHSFSYRHHTGYSEIIHLKINKEQVG